MKVTLNGNEREVRPGTTVEQVVRSATERQDLRGLAVARNRRVVPRSRWADELVEEGDAFEIVGVMQGG